MIKSIISVGTILVFIVVFLYLMMNPPIMISFVNTIFQIVIDAVKNVLNIIKIS